LTERELLEEILFLLLEKKLSRVQSGEVYDVARWLTKEERLADIATFMQPTVIADPYSLDIPRSYSPDGIPDTEGLKVMQQNSRNLGELLLQDDPIDLSGTPVASTAFRTRGWKNILCTMEIAAMATNATGLTCTAELSTDAFDTEAFELLALDGVAMVQTCQVADGEQFAFILPTMSNAGAVAATNTPQAVAIPDIDDMVMRIVFAVVGAGVTAEAATLNVYGCTPR